ncbi:hypothetical protein [Agarivorans sp. Toyoura001]|uniref:hypothetical protein n=1 Tax=unclassified Agarivorans TaxID=2636026 RepID=UPI0010F3C46A|nr:hypothetical protein [Agarivorans sp. Toyoura001]GDY26842.1 hypothetical protein AHAT_27320 [Agarivorans sp. Toyoura001]
MFEAFQKETTIHPTKTQATSKGLPTIALSNTQLHTQDSELLALLNDYFEQPSFSDRCRPTA